MVHADAIVTIQQLGFESLRSVSLDALNSATRTLKAVIQSTPALNAACTHPTEQDLSFLYGIVVVDDHPDADTETGAFGPCDAEPHPEDEGKRS